MDAAVAFASFATASFAVGASCASPSAPSCTFTLRNKAEKSVASGCAHGGVIPNPRSARALNSGVVSARAAPQGCAAFSSAEGDLVGLEGFVACSAEGSVASSSAEGSVALESAKWP